MGPKGDKGTRVREAWSIKLCGALSVIVDHLQGDVGKTGLPGFDGEPGTNVSFILPPIHAFLFNYVPLFPQTEARASISFSRIFAPQPLNEAALKMRPAFINSYSQGIVQ